VTEAQKALVATPASKLRKGDRLHHKGRDWVIFGIVTTSSGGRSMTLRPVQSGDFAVTDMEFWVGKATVKFDRYDRTNPGPHGNRSKAPVVDLPSSDYEGSG